MKLKPKLMGLILILCAQEASQISTIHSKTSTYTYLFNKLMNTRVGFHLWMHGARVKYHTSFTFHSIANDQLNTGYTTTRCQGVCIQQDASGKIIAIHDGKRTPLILGSIPTKQHHLARLKSIFMSNNAHQHIGIFSLNQDWECQTSGLFNLIRHNPNIIHYRYPTQDLHAPSLTDIIQAVHDLEERDMSTQYVSLIHCKAGRGRSATIAAAYLMHIIHKANRSTTVDDVEAYLCKRRPQVHLEQAQKMVLEQFWVALKQAGNFDTLYKNNMQK